MRLKALDREADRRKSNFATTFNPAMPEDFKQHRKVEHLERLENFQPQNRIGVAKTVERWENEQFHLTGWEECSCDTWRFDI